MWKVTIFEYNSYFMSFTFLFKNKALKFITDLEKKWKLDGYKYVRADLKCERVFILKYPFNPLERN